MRSASLSPFFFSLPHNSLSSRYQELQGHRHDSSVLESSEIRQRATHPRRSRAGCATPPPWSLPPAQPQATSCLCPRGGLQQRCPLVHAEVSVEVEIQFDLTSGVCAGESKHHGERQRVPASNIPDKYVPAKRERASDGTNPSECVNRATESITKAARSSPFKKMLSPIMKSKSVRSSPSLAEKEDPNTAAVPASSRNCVPRKSLLSDLSRTQRRQASSNCQPNGESRHMMEASLSPSHLRAVLKCDSRNGIPLYDFCVDGPEESIYAGLGRVGVNSRIYTFHSGGKRGSTAGRSSKDERRCLPPIVGQMQVSSYLCPEVGKDGILNNSVNTEFVLYDIAHARPSFVAAEKTECTQPSQPESCGVVDKPVSREYPQKINLIDHQHDARHNPEVSTSRPWSEEDLYPHLEIAATVI
ncbi:hypothetical protein ZWY2020_042800 [Hordeum vulgare]|nr:hypothetical protein ZWY2020_042800 [Hordeum vulgare]